jgi:hypothetical protein
MSQSSSLKRPCCICRKWFSPDVRQKNWQKTCDNPECRREHHRRLCAKWNKKNKEYFQSNYLNKKLEKVGKPPPETVASQPVTQKIPIPDSKLLAGLFDRFNSYFLLPVLYLNRDTFFLTEDENLPLTRIHRSIGTGTK